MAAGRDAGMTLVEMLVVLAVLGVMAGVTVLGLGSAARGVGVEAEAHRLQIALQKAADEVLVTGRPMAMQIDQNAYRFLEWGASGELGVVKGLTPERALPSGITLASAGLGRSTRLEADGAGAPLDVTVSDGRRAWKVSFDGLRAEAAEARP